jgi:hypothetical protein
MKFIHPSLLVVMTLLLTISEMVSTQPPPVSYPPDVKNKLKTLKNREWKARYEAKNVNPGDQLAKAKKEMKLADKIHTCKYIACSEMKAKEARNYHVFEANHNNVRANKAKQEIKKQTAAEVK